MAVGPLDRPDRWQALHEQLARANYLPSLVRLADDAIEQHEWKRALVIVERLTELATEPVERERMQRLEAQIIHARWVERGDLADFAWLERAAKIAIVRDAKQLEARAALIRLYVEQAAITGQQAPLMLAQLSEREARRIAELEGDRIAAVAAWTRALELDPGLIEAHLWLGFAAIQRRDFAQAQAQAFVDLHPTHGDALLALGVAHRWVGDREAAERAYVQGVWI
jgi:tetratricopeptide (TPR) repeat protein